MAVEIVMPRVDMDMSSGRMGRWHAAEGAHVVKGATLFEIETDKAAMEVDAPASGVLKFVAASEGDVLPVGACIGWIVADGETFVPPARVRARPRPHPGPLPEGEGALGRRRPPLLPLGEGGAIGRPEGRPSFRTGYWRRMRGSARARRPPPGGSRASAACGLRACAAPDRLAAFSGATSRRRRPPRGARPMSIGCGCSGARARRSCSCTASAPTLTAGGRCIACCRQTLPALAIDLPGHGLSSLGEDASFEALVEAARGVLIEEGVSAAHIVGHSLGGAVAAALAHKPGVKALSLMLIAPAGLGDDVNAAFFDGYLQADTEAALTPWLHMLVVDRAALGSALARTTLRQRSERPLVAEQRRLAGALFAGGRQTIDIRGHLAAPEAPTKIVFGLEDRITPARHAEGLSGLIALHRFPRIGHMPHLEARREVARLIEELARTARPA